jgi:hypothetical protein
MDVPGDSGEDSLTFCTFTSTSRSRSRIPGQVDCLTSDLTYKCKSQGDNCGPHAEEKLLFLANEKVLLFISLIESSNVANSGILPHIYFSPTFTCCITILLGSFVSLNAESSSYVLSPESGCLRIQRQPSQTGIVSC